MNIYLPVAEVTVDFFVVVGLGAFVGTLSGIFGVGGGFLLTPLLFFIGVPPAVAVSTQANQIVASSVTGALAHFRSRTLDVRMGVVLIIGGLVGSASGVWLFSLLRAVGQVELLIQIFYVVFLGLVGAIMFVESVRVLVGRTPQKRRRHTRAQGLPLRMRFRTSGLYVSVIPPLAVGYVCGILAAIMGVGGGFILLPAMIYILKMPTKVVVGTSLFQIIFVAGFTLLLHAWANHTVDLVLALMLILGGVVGAQVGTTVGSRLRGEQLRLLLALIVLGTAGKVATDLIIAPEARFSMSFEAGGR